MKRLLIISAILVTALIAELVGWYVANPSMSISASQVISINLHLNSFDIPGGTEYEWINATPVMTDDVNYEWINGRPYVIIHATTSAPSYDIINDPSSKGFGIVDASSTYYAKGSAPSNPVVDGDCIFTITNNGATAIDIDVKGAAFTGGVGWTLTSGAPGSNTVRITVYKTGDNPASGIILTTSDQEFVSNLAAAGTKKWDFKLETGTFTDGVGKSGIVTLTARAVS